MPINAKVDYFFEDSGDTGWVETWYLPETDITAALNTAVTKYAGPRRGILSANYSLVEARVSDTAILRDSLVKAFTFAQGQGQFNPGQIAFDLSPWNALLLRIEATALFRRSLLLRGLPAGILDANGIYTPTAGWTRRFNVYTAACIAAPPFQVRTQRSGPLSRPDATAISGTGFTVSLTYLAGPPAGYVAGAIVRISGAKGVAFLNGLWKIFSVVGNVVNLFQKRRAVIGAPVNNPYTAIVTPGFQNITSVQAERGVKKSTGRPFDLPRGRRRVNQG